MAATHLTVVSVSSAGVEMTTATSNYTAMTTDGCTFVNDGRTFLHVVNTAAGGDTVATIAGAQQCDQGSTHNVTVTIPDDDDYLIGPFEKTRFNASTTGYVTVTFSEDTNVTACPYKMT